MKNKINNAMISNKRVYITIAIVLLVIFIIGIIALGVFKIGRGGDTPSKTYITYVVNGDNMSSDAHLEDDNHTFKLNTEVKYHESLVFYASNSADVDPSGHYMFSGTGISFTLSINEEEYYLESAVVDEIKVSNDGIDPTYLLPENTYTKEYNSESKSYKVTINNTEVRYIHSISLRYSVIKK